MAMYLRRVISSNSVRFRVPSRAGCGGGGGGSITNTESRAWTLSRSLFSVPHNPPVSPPRSRPVDSLKEHRRGFAKGRKSKDDSGGGTVEVDPNVGPAVKASAASQMDAAVTALSRELSKLRTGRASAGMLDHIIVESGGVKTPLNRIAVVAVMDSKTLSVNPYDPSTLKELESAIVSSPLGLNPRADGERLIAAIPPLTKEHIQAISKVVARSCEDVRQSIRRARQKALDSIKRLGSSLPKDDVKKLEKEIDELTKKFVKSAEDMCKAKEKEIASA